MEARMLTEATGEFAYQLLGEEYVATRESAPLQWGYSTGKSRVSLTRVVRDDRIRYALLFARKDNVDTWVKEIKKHTTLDLVELLGTLQSARKIVERFSRNLRSQRTKTVFLLNHDRAKSLEQELTALAADAVLVDEATKIKTWSAERTKAMCRIGHMPQVVFRCPMAGEFAPQNKQDYWGIFYFADKGHTLGRDYYWFLRKFFVKLGHDWILQPGAREVLADLVSKNCHTLATSDVRVPKRVQHRMIPVQPSEEQKYYLNLFGKGVMRRPDGRVDYISNPAVSFEKQLQVTGGYVKWMDTVDAAGNITEQGYITRLQENPKLDALVAFLKEEVPEKLVDGNPKIVVWAQHTEEIKMISERLRAEDIPIAILSGSLNTTEQNSAAKHAFETDGYIRGLVAQAGMGYGLNELVVADTAIWMSNSHVVDDRLQAEARFDRPGQRSNILNHVDIVLEECEDAAVAFSVAMARMDVKGFTSRVKLLQAAREKRNQMTSENLAV